MSENQQAPETTDVEYINKDGIEFDIRIPGKLNDEEIQAYLEKAVPEIEMAEGLREPGFGPFTMGAVPTEAIERGLYGARQIGAILGRELGLLDEKTAAEDIAKMARYKAYSDAQVKREDPAGYDRDRETLGRLGEAKTFSDAMSAIYDNPMAVLPVVGESLGTFAPALVATAATAIATGGLGTPGIVMTALAAGLGSGVTEYGSTFAQSFEESGVDVTDDVAVLSALGDDDKMAEIRDKAQKRGMAIGAFDAATVGFAGKLTSLIKGAPLSAKAAEAPLRTRLGAGTAEAGAQAVGGGGGEAAAQALTGEYKPGEILLEAVAEVPTALPEVALGARATRARKLRRALADRGYTEEQIMEFGSMSGNQQNTIIKELNETNISTTFPAVGEDITGPVDTAAQDARITEMGVEAEKIIKLREATGQERGETSDVKRGQAVQEASIQLDDLIIPTVGETSPITVSELEEASVEITPIEESKQDSAIRQSYNAVIELAENVENESIATGRTPQQAYENLAQNSTLAESLASFDALIEEKYPNLSSENKVKVQSAIRKNQPLPTIEEFTGISLEETAVTTPQDFVPVVEGEVSPVIPPAEFTPLILGETSVVPERGARPSPIIVDPYAEVTNVQEAETNANIIPEQSLESDANRFITSPITPEENAVFGNSQTIDLTANAEETIQPIIDRGIQEFNLSPEDAILAADKRVKRIIREADSADRRQGDPAGETESSSSGVNPPSETAAIERANDMLISGNNSNAQVIRDGRDAIKLTEIPTHLFRNKDLNWFSRWWTFPDVMAERYPEFAPFWNAIRKRRSIVAATMVKYFQPIINPLKEIGSNTEQYNVMRVIELLDQLSPEQQKQYTTNGVFDPSKLTIEGDKYILVNPGGSDVRTVLSKGPEPGKLNGDKIEITAKEMAAIVGIRTSFDLAKTDIIAAYNPNFFFTPETTLDSLSALANRLKELTNFSDSTKTEGDVTVPTENQEEVRQLIRDSGLVILDDPNSFFNTETDPAKLIAYITNYRNNIAVFQENPLYFPHQRYGNIGIRVTANVDDAAQNETTGETVWFQSFKPEEIGRFKDFNDIVGGKSKKANQIKRELQTKYPDATVKWENLTPDPSRFSNRIEIEGVENILSTLIESQSDSLTADQNDAVKDLLTTARLKLIQNPYIQIAPELIQRRKNIPGWVDHKNAAKKMKDTIDIYLGRAAGYKANQETKKERREAIQLLSERNLTKLRDYALDMEKYIDGGYHDVLNLRRIAFHYFLGLNPSSAVVNLTQIPMAGVPWLTRFTPTGRAQLEIMRGMKDAGKIAGLIKGLVRTGSGSVSELLNLENPLGNSREAIQLWNDIKIDLANGRLMAQVTAEQAGLVNYGGGYQVSDKYPNLKIPFKSTVNNLENISSAMFTYVELINRLSTYIAAHRVYTRESALARNRGQTSRVDNKLLRNADYQMMKASPENQEGSEARNFAAFSVDKTQFLMGADNRPLFMRGPVWGVVTQFMQFPVRYLQLIDNLVFREGGVVKNPKERAAALAYMAAFMMMTGGFWSLPLAENAVDLSEFVWEKWAKKDPMIKHELNKILTEMGMENPNYFTRGVIPQMLNISLTSRTGAGRVLQPDMFSGDFSKASGPAGSMIFGSISAALEAINNKQISLAIANLAPTAAYNVHKAYKIGTTGQVKTAKQNRVLMEEQLGLREAIPQVLGFQPENVAQEQLFQWNMRRLDNRSKQLQTHYSNAIKGKYTDYILYNNNYEKSVAQGRPDPEMLRMSRQALNDAGTYIQEMIDINEDMLQKHPDDYSYLLNVSPQTFKSMWKNAMYQAGSRIKPGPKRARATKLWNEYISATPARRARMIREGYIPRPPE